jgi:hypothetical protein
MPTGIGIARRRTQSLVRGVADALLRGFGALGFLACAGLSRALRLRCEHGFRFDLHASAQHYGTPDAEILDYEYGAGSGEGLRPSREAVLRGRVGGRLFVYRTMHAGETLRVRWRNLDSREVHEQRVDLRPLLPRELTGYCVYFEVEGPQLFVYLFPPPYAYAPVPRLTGSVHADTYRIYPPLASTTRSGVSSR